MNLLEFYYKEGNMATDNSELNQDEKPAEEEAIEEFDMEWLEKNKMSLEDAKVYKKRGQDIPIPEDLKEYYSSEIGCAFGYPEEWEKISREFVKK
jgi:hypothetical protein